jgi:uncharacterized membrane protein YgdD (TMEM256/DUF423 family)
MTPPGWSVRVAALCGGLAVALGAFGAHGLSARLTENRTTDVYHTAVLYHFLHALMLFLLATRAPFRQTAYFCFLAGIVIFSGSLYVLALTGTRWLGAITPFGGVAFLVGWLCLVLCPKNNS